jgi:hypothetical protein
VPNKGKMKMKMKMNIHIRMRWPYGHMDEMIIINTVIESENSNMKIHFDELELED